MNNHILRLLTFAKQGILVKAVWPAHILLLIGYLLGSTVVIQLGLQIECFDGLVHDLVFLLERNREVFPLLTCVRRVPLGLEEAHHGRN